MHVQTLYGQQGTKVLKRWLSTFILFAGLALTACTEGEPATEAPTGINIKDQSSNAALFGDNGLFGNDTYSEGRSIGVNSFLWRASLDTISFMPVSSADPFGGVIITDWYAASESPNERFKLNVIIMGRALRADGVRVAAFRQVLTNGGIWRDTPVPDKAATSIEDAILTRARQLRNEILRAQ